VNDQRFRVDWRRNGANPFPDDLQKEWLKEYYYSNEEERSLLQNAMIRYQNVYDNRPGHSHFCVLPANKNVNIRVDVEPGNNSGLYDKWKCLDYSWKQTNSMEG
jgi:hypothetical protein